MSLHLKRLEIFNFAKVKELAVDFLPGVTFLVGMNGSGKSTIINAMWAGLKGIVEKGKPGALIADRFRIIGDNAKTAKTIITLMDTKTDKEITISTKISKHGNDIVIKDSENRILPNDYLDSVFNLMCIDPTSFTRMSGAEQARALGIDTTKLDERIAELKKSRTPINNEVKRLQTVIDNYGEVKKVEEVDLVELFKIRDDIDESNQRQSELDSIFEPSTYTRYVHGYRKNDVSFFDLEFDEKRNAVIEWLETMDKPQPPKSNDEVLMKIENAHETNELARKYADYNNYQTDLANVLKTQQESNLSIKKVEEEKAKYVQDANLPFDNMTIDENGGLLLDEKPFREPYFSTGEIWEKATILLAILNPELQTIFIRGANNLDNNKIKSVEALAEKGYQIIFEFVDDKPVEDRTCILLREMEIVESFEKPL